MPCEANVLFRTKWFFYISQSVCIMVIFWGCLWRCCQHDLTEEKRPTLIVGGAFLWAAVPDRIQRWKLGNTSIYLSLLPGLPGALSPAMRELCPQTASWNKAFLTLYLWGTWSQQWEHTHQLTKEAVLARVLTIKFLSLSCVQAVIAKAARTIWVCSGRERQNIEIKTHYFCPCCD